MQINRPLLKIERRFVKFETALLALLLILAFVPRSQADTGLCSGQTLTLPFTDVMGSGFFCSIAQLYFQGITLGTSPTTYSPAANVTRDQMAAFLARTQNSTLHRGSRRAALNQFWTTTPQYTTLVGGDFFGATAVEDNPQLVASDGADLWVANVSSGSVSQVRASDGQLVNTWGGMTLTNGVLVALGRVFVTGGTNPGRLHIINPGGAIFNHPTALGATPEGIAFDGQRIWTANNGSVSIITLLPGNIAANNVEGFGNLEGILYDGANIWVTETGSPGQLKKLDANGAVIDTATVGNNPKYPIYDGTNIWVPNSSSHSVSVVRPVDGEVLATLTGNGLSGPTSAAFDGQRILITNNSGHSVSLFRAADFAPLGTFSTGANSFPLGACSDGLNFWITLAGPDKLARF